MGIRLGDIDVSSQLLENEFRISVLEQTMQFLIQRMPVIGPVISAEEFSQIQTRAVEQLQKKYPNSGIQLRGLDGK